MLLANIFLLPIALIGQTHENQRENLKAKGTVSADNCIKLRWSPANPKAWVEGRKYGYTVERYTMSVDEQWQQTPGKKLISQTFRPAPLADWETIVNQSDYAAVIAQAFYGEDFELNARSGDIGDIINQANELEQRFSTSVFMAEYDYDAAILAGWAHTDITVKENERYLYRIILNRPQAIIGDTAAVYIGLKDRVELQKPIGLAAVFGDRSAMLSWNYSLLSNTYHSYHIERKSTSEPQYRTITDLPVTALDMKMTEIFYTDSLINNEETYTYRIKGITSFNEEGPLSDEVHGQGSKTITCMPHISGGDFFAENKARIFWEFDCEDVNLIEKFCIVKSSDIDGDYLIALDEIQVSARQIDLDLNETKVYIKLQAINKVGAKSESFPFILQQIDSIPPAIPQGLAVEIDSVGVATLTWNANTEDDLQGYRLLRSFTKDGEKSSVSSDIIIQNRYTDTLSLTLGNRKVYYAISAIDKRYNESALSEDVEILKPANFKPLDPVFTDYNINNDGTVTLNWLADVKRNYIKYYLVRTSAEYPKYNKTVFIGNNKITSFTDEVPQSGNYRYSLIAEDSIRGKKTFSPQALYISVSNTEINIIKGFNAYTNYQSNSIELSWNKHPKAVTYKIYKAQDDGRYTLLKELDNTQTYIIDRIVTPNTKYSYTIQFTTQADGVSKPKTITVDY